jgi:hypothetical protein
MQEENDVMASTVSPYGSVWGAHRIPRELKVRRTYGWLCPFQDYKSNRWSNAQRHIELIHGKGSGEPVDSSTGETKEGKKKNAIRQENMRKSISGPPDPRSGPITLIQSGERFERKKMIESEPHASLTRSEFAQYYGDTFLPPSNGTSCSMPFLEAQARRIKELGYDVPTPTGKYYAGPCDRPTPYVEVSPLSLQKTRKNPNFLYSENQIDMLNDQQDIHEPDYIYQNQYTNSLDVSHWSQVVPVDPQTMCMRMMLLQLGLLREK